MRRFFVSLLMLAVGSILLAAAFAQPGAVATAAKSGGTFRISSRAPALDYVDPALSSTIVLDDGDKTLSDRQREILQMLADGMQTEAVAIKLGLSTETVRTHTKRILAKLGADTRTQAVAIGIRTGLIE